MHGCTLLLLAAGRRDERFWFVRGCSSRLAVQLKTLLAAKATVTTSFNPSSSAAACY
uniref:Uncharacterized protein n=1 Tax=Rhizophora mucronata TaxID=61149 RepID=A0A2P2L8S9_RHIMU